MLLNITLLVFEASHLSEFFYYYHSGEINIKVVHVLMHTQNHVGYFLKGNQFSIKGESFKSKMNCNNLKAIYCYEQIAFHQSNVEIWFPTITNLLTSLM